MNALAAAIAAQYKRQQDLLERQDEALKQLSTIHIRDVSLYHHLREAVHKYYKADFERVVSAINALEAVRDASAEGGEQPATPARPTIVCLCGSTRFWRTFQEAGLQETMAGRIVLSIGAASGTDDQHFGNLPRAEYDAIKEMLDQLHLRKIEMADEVMILNCDGYIGESTSRELAHARNLGKVIRFWEPVGGDS